ncbi:MAG: hypothetical protein N2117_12920 [Anaerolineales bacterium]|nr:hypothetical protein [Anaerolineales bacterium]
MKKEEIKQFMSDWIDDRVAHLRYLGVEIASVPDDPMQTEQGRQLLLIAQAADNPAGLRMDEVHDCIQGLLERLFSIPGEASYAVPHEFWETEVGWATLRALIWAQGDELITISQAVAMTGKRHDWFSHAVQRGRLTAYRDPDEPNPTRRTRLLLSEVESLYKADFLFSLTPRSR